MAVSITSELDRLRAVAMHRELVQHYAEMIGLWVKLRDYWFKADKVEHVVVALRMIIENLKLTLAMEDLGFRP